jgi:hypothetical protein
MGLNLKISNVEIKLNSNRRPVLKENQTLLMNGEIQLHLQNPHLTMEKNNNSNNHHKNLLHSNNSNNPKRLLHRRNNLWQMNGEFHHRLRLRSKITKVESDQEVKLCI